MKTPRTPFVDAQAMNQAHPNTFHVPDAGELSAVGVGDYVKVAAEGERFWVEVLSREGDAFTGRVNNDLVRTNLHGLADTDVVAFESRHVHAIEMSARPKPAGGLRA